MSGHHTRDTIVDKCLERQQIHAVESCSRVFHHRQRFMRVGRSVAVPREVLSHCLHTAIFQTARKRQP